MYKKILVALENSKVDQRLIPHITELALLLKSELLLVHVADGWVARSYSDFDNQLNLKESKEMKADKKYLHDMSEELKAKGIIVHTHLALGDPPAEILKVAEEENCDLIAMTSHGHKFWGHLFFGNTIDYVRHNSKIPLLVLSCS